MNMKGEQKASSVSPTGITSPDSSAGEATWAANLPTVLPPEASGTFPLAILGAFCRSAGALTGFIHRLQASTAKMGRTFWRRSRPSLTRLRDSSTAATFLGRIVMLVSALPLAGFMTSVKQKWPR